MLKQEKKRVFDSLNQYLYNVTSRTIFITNHFFLEKNYSSQQILILKSSNKCSIIKCSSKRSKLWYILHRDYFIQNTLYLDILIAGSKPRLLNFHYLSPSISVFIHTFVIFAHLNTRDFAESKNPVSIDIFYMNRKFRKFTKTRTK